MDVFKGVYPPVVTLFEKDGSFDMEANKKQADFLIDKGVNGLAYLGTSGEFGVLTLSEKKEFISTMTAYVNSRVKVIAGVGSTSLSEAMELIRCSEDAGADGVLLVNPYFSVYDGRMVEAYYDEVLDNTKLPVILYNFPSLTGFDFTYEIVERLARKHENLMGIKDTTPDIRHLKNMAEIKKIKPDFSVFCAYEEQALDALQGGAAGFINATANFAPEFTVGLYQAYMQGNQSDMERYYSSMCKAMEIYAYSQPLFLACKEAVYQRSLNRSCYERLPALALDDATKAEIKEKLKAMFH